MKQSQQKKPHRTRKRARPEKDTIQKTAGEKRQKQAYHEPDALERLIGEMTDGEAKTEETAITTRNTRSRKTPRARKLPCETITGRPTTTKAKTNQEKNDQWRSRNRKIQNKNGEGGDPWENEQPGTKDSAMRETRTQETTSRAQKQETTTCKNRMQKQCANMPTLDQTQWGNYRKMMDE